LAGFLQEKLYRWPELFEKGALYGVENMLKKKPEETFLIQVSTGSGCFLFY
jgi:hypothetical protein